jgi:hypothetical protein
MWLPPVLRADDVAARFARAVTWIQLSLVMSMCSADVLVWSSVLLQLASGADH